MADTFEDVQSRARRDPVFFASLVLNPPATLQEAGITLEDASDITKVEFLVRTAQENLKAAARLVDIELGTAAWGIGAGCCNGRLLLPGELVRPGEKLQGRFERPIGPQQ